MTEAELAMRQSAAEETLRQLKAMLDKRSGTPYWALLAEERSQDVLALVAEIRRLKNLEGRDV